MGLPRATGLGLSCDMTIRQTGCLARRCGWVLSSGTACASLVKTETASPVASFYPRGATSRPQATVRTPPPYSSADPVFRFPFRARGHGEDASAALPRRAVTVVPPVTMTVPSLAIAGDPTAQGMFARTGRARGVCGRPSDPTPPLSRCRDLAMDLGPLAGLVRRGQRPPGLLRGAQRGGRPSTS